MSQADVNTDTDIVNGALFELKAAETDASITTTVDTLAGATPSIDIPAYTTAELLTEKVQVHNEVAKEDSDAGGLSLSDESFPNGGARGAFKKPSRSLRGYG